MIFKCNAVLQIGMIKPCILQGFSRVRIRVLPRINTRINIFCNLKKLKKQENYFRFKFLNLKNKINVYETIIINYVLITKLLFSKQIFNKTNLLFTDILSFIIMFPMGHSAKVISKSDLVHKRKALRIRPNKSLLRFLEDKATEENKSMNYLVCELLEDIQKGVLDEKK